MTLQLRAVEDQSVIVRSNQLPIVIGRGEDVDVRIACRWASRRHCEIDCHDGGLVLRDLRSRYGTTLNGKPIHEAAIVAGDEVTVGLKRFVVEVEDANRARAPKPYFERAQS